MSDKLAMPAVDKVQIKVQLKVATKVKLEKLAKSTPFSLSGICEMILEDATKKVDFTEEDQARANEIINHNREILLAAKERKGIKPRSK